MAKFRIDSMGGLARQMQFTPAHALGAQLASAEELLYSLDPAKAYPYDFVLYRITGYRPRETGADLLTGLALQHDLGLLIEQLSETLDLKTAEMQEPVLSIEDVATRFNVTSKTIQRWRRKGLAARRFIFPDGKRRVGFLLRSVERFIAAHEEQVVRSANFSQVDDPERKEILRRARRLAVRCRCCRNEIARRIAKHLHRSPLTILHTIKKHDEEFSQEAIFPLAARGLTAEERAMVLKGHRRGLTLAALARRLCRPRVAVYRVLMEERIARLTRKKVKFIDDPLYHTHDAAEAIEAIADQQPLEQAVESPRIPKGLPPYLEALYRTPLLGAARERALFLKFNYYKFRFVKARRLMDVQFARSRQLDIMERHLRHAQHVKNQIVQANLRLVVSVARRHWRPGLDLMELVSDGNITLMRAAESFDIHKGNRFSTYATLALMKGFARSVSQMRSFAMAAGGENGLDQHPDRPRVSAVEQFALREDVGALLGRLTDRERSVLVGHFGLDESAPATYEQIGRRLGLSKQRIRQIEQAALAKLRA
jgi:RNA polymerase sigma factor (sigma-70 family)